MIEARWPETLNGPITTRFVHLSRSDSIDNLPEAIRRDVRERITVEIPDTEAVAWLPWLRQNLPQAEWSLGDKPRTLAGTVVRDGDASQWYVTARYPSRAVAHNSRLQQRIHTVDACSSWAGEGLPARGLAGGLTDQRVTAPRDIG